MRGSSYKRTLGRRRFLDKLGIADNDCSEECRRIWGCQSKILTTDYIHLVDGGSSVAAWSGASAFGRARFFGDGEEFV